MISEAPVEAVLRFSEQVSLTGGSAAVLDDAGATVSAEASVVDVNVVIPLDGGLGDGTYTITWSVISADSHRISGASVFHVGAPSAGGPVDVDGGSGAGWGVRFLASVLTGVAYAGALVGVGGWWITMLLLGRAPDARWAAVIDRAAVLAAAALVAAIPLRIARLGGGMSALRDGDFLGESLRGPIGVSTAVTASALLAMAAFASAAQRRWSLAWWAAAAGAVALAGFAIEGHTRTQQPIAAMVALDVVHLAAGALWLGGIAALVTWFRAGVDPGDLARYVVKFSGIAVIAVVVVVGAGLAMALIVLPSLDDLYTTGYGLALLTKVALVIPVIAMGAYNRRRLVPQMSAGAAAAPARRLGRIVLVELAILLVVVGVTSVLVARSPVTTSAAAPAVTAPPDAVELPLTNGAGNVSFAIAPCARRFERDPGDAERPLRPATRTGGHADGRAHRGGAGGRPAAPDRPPVRPRRVPRDRRLPAGRDVGRRDRRARQRLRRGVSIDNGRDRTLTPRGRRATRPARRWQSPECAGPRRRAGCGRWPGRRGR